MNEYACFLDFDGVLCDSLPECYETSLRAWKALSHASTESDEERKELFRLYRPFIRNGGDYLLLQLAIDKGIALQSQEAFDTLQKEHSELSEQGDKLFQEYRARFLSSEPQRWFTLNPLYPGIAPILSSAFHNEDVYILSTKPVHFIQEILAFHSVPWPKDRIICSKPKEKVDIILEVMGERGRKKALFVEDQIDHLLTAAKKGDPGKDICLCLASWGYITEEWKLHKNVELISIETLTQWIEALKKE